MRQLQNLALGSQTLSSSEDEQTKLTQQVKKLEGLISLKEAEIERLRNQVELLSKLTISLEDIHGNPFVSSGQNLEIAQALVGQVITTRSQQPSPVLSESTFSPSFVTSDAVLDQIEQRKLATLVRRLQKLPRLQRSILRLLAEHEGDGMTIPAIATWLSLKENTVRSRPPHDLLKMKLITRTRVSRGYKYMSVLSSFLRSEFPRTEPHVVMDDLLSKIDGGMYKNAYIQK